MRRMQVVAASAIVVGFVGGFGVVVANARGQAPERVDIVVDEPPATTSTTTRPRSTTTWTMAPSTTTTTVAPPTTPPTPTVPPTTEPPPTTTTTTTTQPPPPVDGVLGVSVTVLGWEEAADLEVLYEDGTVLSGRTTRDEGWAAYAPLGRARLTIRPAEDSLWLEAGRPAGCHWVLGVEVTTTRTDVRFDIGLEIGSAICDDPSPQPEAAGLRPQAAGGSDPAT